MQMTKNMRDVQNFAQTNSDEVEFETSVRLLLNDEKHCRVSLAGNGPSGVPSDPVVFKKSEIDDETAEGLDIALYFANQAGDQRTLKKFNGQDNPGTDDKSKFGKLTIKSLKLIMNNPTGAGADYNNSSAHNDIGIIRAVLSKKMSSTQTREIISDFAVNVGMATGQSPESSGETRILTCSRVDKMAAADFTYPEGCSMTFSHSDAGGAYRNVALNMDSGGFVGLRLRGDVNGDDRFRISSSCSSGSELTDYMRSCSIGFGWKDNTDSSSSINAFPSSSKSYNTNFGGTITLQTGGDVNSDDSFYYRIRCPNGSNSDLNEYVKNKCQICMGHTDHYYYSPEKTSCKKVQNSSDNSWGRIMTSGDVGADDALFLGFFCEGEFSPVIKAWAY